MAQEVAGSCDAQRCNEYCGSYGSTDRNGNPGGGQCRIGSVGGIPTWICGCNSTCNAPPVPTIPGTGFEFGNLIRVVYDITLPLAIILGFILIVIGGYMFMTSQGDPKKTMEAKERLTSAIMGMLFVLLSIGILRILIGSLITGEDPGF